jgi:1-phosphofructokinase family hexose kinase
VILTVTPNPALDITYDVDELVPHTSHRVNHVRELAGGKGINVASVLTLLGVEVVAASVVGGATGAQLRADLDARGIRHDLLDGGAPTRRTVTVVSAAHGEATAFNEPGVAWTEQHCDAFLAHVQGLLSRIRPRVLVVSGSVPPGFRADGCAALVRAGHETGAQVVLDASRTALTEGLVAEPDVIKPNRDELREATGSSEPLEGAKALQRKGARHVLVSLGAEGVLHVSPDGVVHRARLGRSLRGNATGAGDAAVAAVAHGLAEGRDWPHVVADAVAWSAAAVLQPVAGVVAPGDVDELAGSVTVERVEVG